MHLPCTPSSSCKSLFSLILEKDDSVCWHRGMLFLEAQSQVSFLKDLVTERDRGLKPNRTKTYVKYIF
ncbi:SidA/IucD/PvdA family monooxygenase [bacterium BS0013]